MNACRVAAIASSTDEDSTSPSLVTSPLSLVAMAACDEEELVYFCGVASLSGDEEEEEEEVPLVAKKSPRAPATPRRRIEPLKRKRRRAKFARALRGEHRAASQTLVSCTSLCDGSLSRARSALEAGDARRAAGELSRAAKLCESDEDASWTFAALAACACRLGEPYRAIRACEQGAVHGDSAWFSSLRGAAFAQLGRFEEAATWCERAIDGEPLEARVHAHHTLGMCFLGMDAHASAYREFARGFLLGEANDSLVDVGDDLRTQVTKRVLYSPQIADDLALAARRLATSDDASPRLPRVREVASVRDVVDVRECDALVARALEVDRWRTNRHGAHPTRDCAVADLGQVALDLVNRWLESSLLPLATRRFGLDGVYRVHDAFVVYYAADSGHTSLPVHQDQAHVSVSLGLNAARDYDGGGLRFADASNLGTGGDCVDCDQGQAILFASSLHHEALPVTRGRRFVLALFLYADRP